MAEEGEESLCIHMQFISKTKAYWHERKLMHEDHEQKIPKQLFIALTF